MQEIVLSLLLFTPLLAAVTGLFIPLSSVSLFRYLALTASLIQVGLLILILVNYQSAVGLQFVEQQPWITLHLGSWGTLQAQYFWE